MIGAFAIGGAREVLFPILEPGILGSHAVVYAEAARAWLSGGNPWAVGPSAVVFAGPPPMLLPFAPFAFLPADVTRWTWVFGTAALAIWSVRRLRLPGYWIGFPPILAAIILGHPEVVVLGLLVAGGAASGLSALIKPYAAFALLAERRWRALVVASIAFVISLPFLPWSQFLTELPHIGATLARQNRGDSVFGDPVLMLIAALALAALGPRRALWLATPVLWPNAQPLYKVPSTPAISPVIATFWALPIAGATLVGLVVEAAVVLAARRVALPNWLRAGVSMPDGGVRQARAATP